MSKTITIQEAREKLAVVVENNYSGADFPAYVKALESIREGRCTPYLRYSSPIWGGDATVYLRERMYLKGKSLPRFDVHISWLSMSRTITKAHAALETYQQALKLATLLEATIQGLPDIVEEKS